MNLIINNWKKEDYNNFIDYLKSLKDVKYQQFQRKLTKKDNIIGIKTPILKKIAKEISKGNYLSFIELNNHNHYEETIIHGFILGFIKNDYSLVFNLFNEFIKYIDNWAVNDQVIANMKIFRKNLDVLYNNIDIYLQDNNPWINRVGVVILLDYYVKNDYIDKILMTINDLDYKEYYTNMAIAWLICECYIKYKEKTLIFLKHNKINKWTHNKAISKIIESTRIDSNEKKLIKKLKKL